MAGTCQEYSFSFMPVATCYSKACYWFIAGSESLAMPDAILTVYCKHGIMVTSTAVLSSAPRDFWPGNFCWRMGKKRQGKKRKGVKIEKKRRKIVKWKEEKWWGPFFFFFFFFCVFVFVFVFVFLLFCFVLFCFVLFCFVLFCFVLFCFVLFLFLGFLNLSWVYQNGNFLPGKNISSREKNQEKWLCPLRKIWLLRPCFLCMFSTCFDIHVIVMKKWTVG